MWDVRSDLMLGHNLADKMVQLWVVLMDSSTDIQKAGLTASPKGFH
jgi:hypothetical protein